MTSKLKMGVSAGFYFGLGVDYDDDWAGRYSVQDPKLITMGVNPRIGYRINDWLSLGGGFSILYAELEQKVAINNAVAEGDPTLLNLF